MVADFVRSFTNTVDGYAEGLQEQTFDQLARTASDFTRREPALVFGLAAVAGFFVFRTMKRSFSTMKIWGSNGRLPGTISEISSFGGKTNPRAIIYEMEHDVPLWQT